MPTPTKQKKNITFSGADLIVDGTATNTPPMYYSLCNIKSVEPVYAPLAGTLLSKYNFASQLMVVINFTDGQGSVSRLAFDIQEVQNQAGWTANFAGLLQCLTDISAARAVACSGGSVTIDVTASEMFMRQDYEGSPVSDGDPQPYLLTDATGRLKVNASKTNLVEGNEITSPVAPAAYSDGDVIGSLITFNNVVENTYTSGKITGVSLLDGANGATDLQADLFLFTVAPTVAADNAAFNPSFSEMRSCIGVAQFASPRAASTTITFYPSTLQNAIGFVTGGGVALYGVLVARNAYTHVASEKYRVYIDVEENFS
jgi:hypothetical protein